MAKICIGNIKTIAIEFEVIVKNENNVYLGFCKIWIGGQSLEKENEIMFIKGYLLNELERIEKVPTLDQSINDSSSTNYKFEYFLLRLKDLNDDTIDDYRFNFGPISDDYIIFVYKCQNKLTFLWRYVSEKEENDMLVREQKIDIIEYSDVVNTFKSIIEMKNLK